METGKTNIYFANDIGLECLCCWIVRLITSVWMSRLNLRNQNNLSNGEVECNGIPLSSLLEDLFVSYLYTAGIF